MIPSKEAFAKSVFLCCAIASAAVILVILGFMVALGIPLFRESTLSAIWTGPWAPPRGAYGIWAMIAGTFWIAFTATMICLPLSLGMSFVISCLGKRHIRRLLGALVRCPSGVKR